MAALSVLEKSNDFLHAPREKIICIIYGSKNEVVSMCFFFDKYDYMMVSNKHIFW